MSEWWTYRPSDFLMFAPRTYWRLFELHNEAWWPAQPLLLLAGLAWLVVRSRRSGDHAQALHLAAAGLAVLWAFVAWQFLALRYAPINWAASGFALGFGAQALVLAALAGRKDLRATARRSRGRIALLLGGWALIGHPLLGLAFGRPLAQAEVFGLAPDPTALATLGVLLGSETRSPVGRLVLGLAWGLALAWCAVSAATLLTLGAPQGWVPLAAALVALAAARVGSGATFDRPPDDRRAG